MIALIAFGSGIYVGLHFTVLGLLPLSFLGAGAYFVSSWSSGHNVFDAVLPLVFAAIALQGGYMLGLTCREAYSQFLARDNSTPSKPRLRF